MSKYRLFGSAPYQIEIMDKKPRKDIYKHISFPEVVTPDLIAFAGKMVESGPNLNRAYFDQAELVKARPTLLNKAIDIEHEVDKVIGHIYQGAYIERESNLLITSDNFNPEKHIDVVIGGIVYIDRFPQIESSMSRKAYGLSMECWFDAFSLLLENGIKLSLEEAEALGLAEFIEQLFGKFKSQEDFDNAHSLMVTCADQSKKKLKLFKFLHDITWAGVAVVGSPACPSCTVLNISGNDEDEMATASQLFSLDLRRVESYMELIRNNKEISPINFQVIETLENCDCPNDEQATDTFIPSAPPTANPPTGVGLPHTPNDFTSFPAACPQYRLDADMWCAYADQQCVTAGDRTFKDCHRWTKDPVGRWLFDTRSTNKEEDGLVPSGDEEASTEGVVEEGCVASVGYKLAAASYAREVWACENESAAIWTTQFIESLPNSCFAVVETGYKDHMDKNARHLPFKDSSGKVDLTRLKDALVKAKQIKAVLGSDTDSELRNRAQNRLAPYAKKYLSRGEGD